MDKVAYFSKSGQFSLEVSKQIEMSKVQNFEDVKELLNYLLVVPDTPYMIFETKNIEEDRKYIEAIFTLNSMLPIFFLSSEDEKIVSELQNEFNTLHLCSADKTLDDFIKEIDKNPRKANRVNWPLTAKFFKDPEKPVVGTGNITSLSIGGLYTHTNHLEGLSLDDKVYLDIAFMDFSFLVEGIVVKLVSANESDTEMGGFSVKFEKISEHTRKYILDLINHKLINMLVNDL